MVYTFTAGEQPTADNLNAIFDQSIIRKAAAESVTSSTTAQNDDDFSVALPVGKYLVWIWLHCTGATAADIKTVWSNTGTMTILRSCLGAQTGTADRQATTVTVQGSNSTTEVPYGCDGAGTTVVREELYVDVTVTGTLTLQWAQNASSGTATNLSTASRMWIVNVE